MYYDRQKVIDLALSQVGYHEKASNADLDSNTSNSGDANWTKYARDMDAMGGFYNGRKNGYAWCDCFVDWCFVTAYGRAGAQFLLCQPDNSAGAGCSFSAQYFNARGQFHKSNPQPGDQIFFGSAWNNVWHTGLVISVGNNHVYTVEGNTSDMVARRSYALNDSYIFGYGRPDWGTQTNQEPSTPPSGDPQDDKPVEPQKPAEKPAETAYMYNVKLPLLQIGDKNGYVKAVQTLLIERGYDCGNRKLIGREKPDGEFGQTTEKAVAAFQRDYNKNCGGNLDVDGEVGGATWAALLKFD